MGQTIFTQFDYVRRLHSTAKKRYALAYLEYLDGRGPHPDRPGNTHELSVMARRSVRIRLAALGMY